MPKSMVCNQSNQSNKCCTKSVAQNQLHPPVKRKIYFVQRHLPLVDVQIQRKILNLQPFHPEKSIEIRSTHLKSPNFATFFPWFTPNFHPEPPPQPPKHPRRHNPGGGAAMPPPKVAAQICAPARAPRSKASRSAQPWCHSPLFVFFLIKYFFSLSAAPWVIYVWGDLSIGDLC